MLELGSLNFDLSQPLQRRGGVMKEGNKRTKQNLPLYISPLRRGQGRSIQQQVLLVQRRQRPELQELLLLVQLQ